MASNFDSQRMISQLDMFGEVAPTSRESSEVRSSRTRTVAPTASPEDMVRTLEESGNYRILRKLPPREIIPCRRPEFPLVGVIVDTETTGLNHKTDEIIEIGAIAFSFDDHGNIGELLGVYGGLQQPSGPIPAEVTRITGITGDMVEGQAIDLAAVRRLIEPVDLIIAHNAGFDRPFCERFSNSFANKAWACSVREIDWSARGFEGTKLGYLVGQAGFFHEGHRAVDDCFALLEILERSGGQEGGPFAELLRTSRQSRVRIFAEHSPFDMKDHLKARGYRWSDGSDGRPKSWWIEVDEDALADEVAYLRAEIYRWDEADPPTQYLTALDRYRA
jgi:DNA polymerase-3 subunit epsilon